MSRSEDWIEAASCYQIAVGIVILRELRPVVFEEYLLNPQVARVFLWILTETVGTGLDPERLDASGKSLWRKMSEEGVSHDPVLFYLAQRLKKAMQFYIESNDVSPFSVPVRLARLA